MYKNFKIYLVLLLLPVFLYPQNQNIKFEQVSVEQGFSESVVNCILQDRNGFMWFGTHNGLIKYDGYKFIYLKNKDNSSGLNIYNVSSICQSADDNKNILWIGSQGGGLNKLDLETEQFTSYLHDPNNQNSLSTNLVHSVYEDKTGMLWIGTNGGGLNKLDPGTNKFSRYLYDSKSPFSLSNNKVTSILEDQSGVFWIGTSGRGLNRFDRQTEQFTHYLHDPNNPNSLSNDTILSIYESSYDGKNVLWIGTRGGLNRFDQETKRFTHFLHDPNNPNTLSNNIIWSINESHGEGKHELWVGAHNGGLNKFDWETEQFIRYFPDSNNTIQTLNDWILSIYEDQAGVLWIGRFGKGLSKIDRKKTGFTHYQHDPNNSNSLSCNAVRQIYEDQSGMLWIGTYDGLNKFNRENQQFVQYKHDPNDRFSLSNNFIQSIYEDQSGVLWIGTYDGLNKLDQKSGQFIQFRHDPQDSSSLSNNYIRSIFEDQSGELWIGTFGGGLNRFNRQTERFTHYTHDSINNNCISNNNVLTIHETNHNAKNVLWIGTKSGLNKFDPATAHFTHYCHDSHNPNSISHNTVWAIAESQINGEKVLWVGTNAGLNKFELRSERFTPFPEKAELQNEVIMGISEDEHNNLWLSTRSGLVKFNPIINKIGYYNKKGDLLKKGFNSRLYHNTAHAGIPISGLDNARELAVSADGTIFFGSISDGLSSFKYDGISFTQTAHNKVVAVYDIALSSDGTIFLAADDRGLQALTYNGSSFTNVTQINDGGKARGVAVGSDSTIFLANYDDGLRAYSYDGSSFTNTAHINTGGRAFGVTVGPGGTIFLADQNTGLRAYSYDGSSFTNTANIYEGSVAYDVAIGQDGTIFLANYYGGLRAYVYNGTSFTSKAHIYDGGESGGRAFKVAVGAEGTIFLGNAEDGLRIYEFDGSSFSNIAHIYDGGEAWGVAVGADETVFLANADEVTDDGADNGLRAYCYQGTSFLISKDREMFFGGPNGLIAFSSESVKENTHIPQLVITDFQLFYKSVQIKKDNNAKDRDIHSLPKHISYLDKIGLSYRENILSFEFAALDYHSPQKNQYAYKMEGVDPEWVFTDASRRFATYTQLDPGEYTFRVKGSNNDGIWNEQGTSIKIIITPPWWKTKSAYILYFVFCISLIVAFWRFQTNRLKMKHQLEIEHLHAEKLEEVDQMKSHFFANISHEFRTPLTLIQGPIKQMLSDEFKGNIKEQYRMILRYSDRLLKLINQILDLSKLESGRMKLKVRCIDIVKFMKGIVQSFASLAERNKISLKFSANDESVMGYIDPDKLEKILTNLLSNAFKFTPEGGEVKVTISNPPVSPLMHKGGNKGGLGENIEIAVSNSGPGIPPERQEKIFDRFYQADESYTKDSEGTGIGLALTKELVEAHHGEIKVESEVNRGTTFTVWLPINREYFKPEEILEEPENGTRKPETEKKMSRKESAEDSAVSSIKASDVTSEYECWSPVSPSDGVSRTGGLRSPLLLIVEDNPDVTTYISSFLDKDYRIITAENGEAGWKKTLQKFPDLIISDVMMPVMDGFEYCRKLKSDQRTSHIPLILLTARADMESKLEGLEFGADDYVTKPFDAKELAVRSRNLLEQRHRLKMHFQQKVDFQPSEITVNSMDEKFIEKAIKLIEKYMDDTDFNVEKFSQEIGMSSRNLSRKLHAITNFSTQDFIRMMRLKRAAQLLQKKSDPVTQIAYQVGFNNPAYFAQCFRHQFGMSPSEYTTQHSQKN